MLKLPKFFKRKKFGTWKFDLFFDIALFVTAFAVRMPWLWEVPRYIDELKEINLGYQIYLGKTFPLHNMAPEIGALHNYILAGIFKIFGVNLFLPRLYVTLTSALTVIVVYHLGKRLYNQWTGIIASGLLLTNGMHILVTHMAWSNCTTPFFFALAMLMVVIAEQERSGKLLVVGGFLWALTLQTHSSVIIYLLVVSVYILSPYFREKTNIPLKYYLLSGMAFTLGYANMLYYNILSRGGSIGWIFVKDYTLEKHIGFTAFLHNFEQMVIQLMRSLAAGYQTYSSLLDYLKQPLFVICLFMMGLGVAASIRKRQILPLWLILGGFFIIPWINHRYGFFIVTRYIMPVILCSTLMLAYGFFRLMESIIPKANQKLIIIPTLTVILVAFGAIHLTRFYSYCSNLANSDMSNRLSLRVVGITEKWARQNSVILIDPRTHMKNNPLPLLLTMNHRNYTVHRVTSPLKDGGKKDDPMIRALQRFQGYGVIVIMSDPTYQKLKRKVSMQKIKYLSERLILSPSKLSVKEQPGIVRIYIAKVRS